MTDVFMNTYHRLPVTFVRGEGCWLWDGEGRRYLDFTSGIAVNCLGHAHPEVAAAIAEQAKKFNHVSNYFQSDVSAAFAERLVAASAGMKKVFLANSGAEANEGACKIARKYSYAKYGPGRHRIVTLKGSFHGRTITTLSATGQEAFHKDFGPFTEGFIYIEGGDLEALDRALDPLLTAAFFVEPIQGESGIRVQSEEFITTAARLCAERDILLMFDEVQSGMGRTGTFLACEGYGVNADVVTLAKGICAGVPAGAVLAGEKAADVLQGDHGSTFGGNPLAAAAGLVVLEKVTDPAFLGEISRKGELIRDTVRGWKHPAVKEIRGKGLMIGVDIDGEAWPVLEKGIARAGGDAPGLLLLGAGKETLRFLPPYVITDEEILTGLEILRELL
ncbi:MAG: acetylornithine/succinylornithine family transaminase [Treponema sp.]|nr:acetylornithine/succinylornithine family transaminase [Treponema sp.]